MSTISERFYIIGHRGAAGERLENSLDGFRHALTLDIDSIELDVREQAGELWVFHDHDLVRLTDHQGQFSEQFDLSRVRLKNGEPIPTLKQVLDLTWGEMPLNIEIKAVDRIELLADLLAQYPTPQATVNMPWILISSFDHRALLRLRQMNCPWPLAPISSGIPLTAEAELAQLDPWSWHFDNEYLDFGLVEQLRERGVLSLVYTVNSTARARELKQRGVAGIFTDLPTEMLHID